MGRTAYKRTPPFLILATPQFKNLQEYYQEQKRNSSQSPQNNSNPTIKMPGEPDETHAHESTSMTEAVANNPSSKTGTTASSHPAHQDSEPKGDKVQFLHHKANPGPAMMPEGVNVQQEGTKEERMKRTEEMNK